MTPSTEVSSPRVRIAAEILWRALVVVAGLHVYWLLGGAWAVHALAAVVNFSASTNWERYAIGPFVLVLALLGLLVATPGTRRPSRRRFLRTDVNQHLQQGLHR